MFQNIFHSLLNLLFPKKSSVTALEKLAGENKLRTLAPSPETPHSFIRALFHYKDPKVRTLVWEIKYSQNPKLTNVVGEIMAEEILSFFEEKGSFISKDWVLVPIPASKNHLKERGFSQTDELCLKIMKHIPKDTLTYASSAIKKVKETTPQAKIRNKSERLKNLKGTFRIAKGENLSNKNIIIVDDVVTTGSTLVEAKRALKEAGAKQVIAITVAH